MFEVSPRHDVADLKRRLIAAWSGLQQHVIDEKIDQWHGRLRACVIFVCDILSRGIMSGIREMQ